MFAKQKNTGEITLVTPTQGRCTFNVFLVVFNASHQPVVGMESKTGLPGVCLMNRRRKCLVEELVIVLTPIHRHIDTVGAVDINGFSDIGMPLNGVFPRLGAHRRVEAFSAKAFVDIAKACHCAVPDAIIDHTKIALLGDVIQLSALDIGIRLLLRGRSKQTQAALGFPQRQCATCVVLAASFQFQTGIATIFFINPLTRHQIDHAAISVRAVLSGAWASNHFDSGQIFQHDWQIKIVMAGLWIIHANAIQQNQRLLVNRTTNAQIDLGATATALPYIQPRHPFQRVGQIGNRQ